MKSLRRALWLLAAAGLFVGVIDAAVILTSDHTQNRGLITALVLLIAWSFIGTGLYAWARRPANRTGAIMVATGFAWFLLPLTAANAPAVFVVGGMFNSVPIVLAVYLLLAFPTGELRGRGDRAIVALGVFAGIVLQVIGGLFLDTADSEHCDGCPTNPLLVADSPTVHDIFNNLQTLLGVAVLATMVIVLVRRFRQYPPAQRTAVSPVMWTGGIAVACFSVTILASLLGVPQAVSSVCFIITVCAFVTVPFAFLYGLMRMRFSNAGAVSDLVERLGSAPTGADDLRAALADALGDPTLEILYWLPEQQRYVDFEGRPAKAPVENSERCVSQVSRDGRCIAALVYDAASQDDPELVRTAGAAAALALENERLEAALRARVEELRSSRSRLVEASDTARRKLERDLHDGAQQRLVALSLDLKLARSKLDGDPAAAAELLDRSLAELDAATGELRELARGIHPAVLTDRGLTEAVKALATRAPLPVEVSGSADEQMPAPVESAAYFVVSEALTNVARYAQASHAAVTIARSNGSLLVEVRDDGVGGADPQQGSGLRGLEDRIAALDGKIEVVSPAGQGTTVKASLPCG